MRILAGIIVVMLGLLVALTLVIIFGPREPTDPPITFQPEAIGPDPEAYLSNSEAKIGGIRADVRKRIVWTDPSSRDRTRRVLVYLHGFSATSEEIRPVPDRVAAELGANIVYTRLTGHGRDGTALAEARFSNWMNDVAEALFVAKRIGDEVVVIGTSTGASLAVTAVGRPDLAPMIDALVLISPNFRVANPRAEALRLPYVRLWGPMVFGRVRSLTPINSAHGKYWTTTYPAVATVSMATAVAAANAVDFSAQTKPALFIFDPADRVVDHRRTREIAAAWGGRADLQTVNVGPQDDPSAHVIAGDILSPPMTEPITRMIVEWVKGL